MKNSLYKIISLCCLIFVIFLLSSTSLVFATDPATTATQGGGNINSQGGGNTASQAGGNITSQGGGNINAPIFTLTNPLKVDSIGGLVQSLVEIFSYIAILFAVVMIIYVGFQYVTYAAQGNVKKIEELNKQMLMIIIGVAIVIAARVMVQVVINTLQATGVVSPEVIQSANKAAKIQ